MALNSYAGVAASTRKPAATKVAHASATGNSTAKAKTVASSNKKKPHFDSSLSNLSIDAAPLNQVFSPATLTYSATIPNSASSVTITVAAADPNAAIEISGVSTYDTTGSASVTEPMPKVGPGNGNVIEISVTTSGGNTTYFLVIERLPTTPTISATAAATNITISTATLGYTLSDDGGEPLISQGVVYGTSSNPVLLGSSELMAGRDVGTFSVTATNLNSNTIYYARGFARNAVGTSYGPQITFLTGDRAPVVTATLSPNYCAPGSAGIVASPNVTITDLDDTNLQGVTVTGAQSSYGDVLAMAPIGNLTASFNSDTLFITGTGTIGEYQAALRTVTFQSNGTLTGIRLITAQAFDGRLESNSVTINDLDVIVQPAITTSAAAAITTNLCHLRFYGNQFSRGEHT